MNSVDEIKNKLVSLAKEHNDAEDEMAFWIEEEATELIVTYCEQNQYLINGFPTEKRNQNEEDLDEDIDDDYFNQERYHYYLDLVSLEKEDVADLWYFYHILFWPDLVEIYKNKKIFLEEIENNIKNGGYDFEL